MAITATTSAGTIALHPSQAGPLDVTLDGLYIGRLTQLNGWSAWAHEPATDTHALLRPDPTAAAALSRLLRWRQSGSVADHLRRTPFRCDSGEWVQFCPDSVWIYTTHGTIHRTPYQEHETERTCIPIFDPYDYLRAYRQGELLERLGNLLDRLFPEWLPFFIAEVRHRSDLDAEHREYLLAAAQAKLAAVASTKGEPG
jgi:hypothetical protein